MNEDMKTLAENFVLRKNEIKELEKRIRSLQNEIDTVKGTLEELRKKLMSRVGQNIPIKNFIVDKQLLRVSLQGVFVEEIES